MNGGTTMRARAWTSGGKGRRQEGDLRRSLLLSSAGHVLALAACLALGAGDTATSGLATVEVVLVAAGPGRSASPPPGSAGTVGAPPLPASQPVGIRAGRSELPQPSAPPVHPEEATLRAESAWSAGVSAAIPPSGKHSAATEQSSGATPAVAADAPGEAGRDGDFETPADAGVPLETASSGTRGREGESPGTATSGFAPTAAALRDRPAGAGRGGGDGAAAARLRDAIQSAIVYPDEAVRRGLEGEVLLRIRVGNGGSPGEIRVARSSGARILDEAARRGVVRAAPLPSVPGWVDVPVRFVLRRPAGDRP